MSEMQFTDSNFESEVLKSGKIALVDFFASWCGPCKLQGPIVEELAAEIGAKAKIGKMDVDANPQIAGRFEIMSIPTIIIFKNGEAIQRFTGLQGKEVLLSEINKLL